MHHLVEKNLANGFMVPKYRFIGFILLLTIGCASPTYNPSVEKTVSLVTLPELGAFTDHLRASGKLKNIMVSISTIDEAGCLTEELMVRRKLLDDFNRIALPAAREINISISGDIEGLYGGSCNFESIYFLNKGEEYQLLFEVEEGSFTMFSPTACKLFMLDNNGKSIAFKKTDSLDCKDN